MTIRLALIEINDLLIQAKESIEKIFRRGKELLHLAGKLKIKQLSRVFHTSLLKPTEQFINCHSEFIHF